MDQNNASTVVLPGNPNLPQLSITAPTSQGTFSTNSNVMSLGGTMSDLASTITSLTWTNNRGGNGTTDPTASWTTGPIELFSGENTLTVTATDAAGNSATANLEVDYSPPTITDVWTGAVSTDWNNPGNWSTDTVPVGSDYVAINAGTIVINSGVNAAAVFFNSGILDCTGGTLNSTTLSIASGAVMNIVSNNSNPVSIWGGTLNNSGTINWSGGNIEVDTGAVINNLSGGVIDATDDHLMFHQYNSQPTFNNAGLFEKTGGTGTTSFSSIAFNNNGTVDVQNGALSIPNLINNGKAIGSGALLLSGTLGGTGTLGGQDNVLNGSVSGTLTLTGILNSTSGSSLNSAVVSIASGAVMNIVSNNSNPVSIWGGTLNNSGTINWSGGNIEVDTGAVINNLSGGVIDATDDHLMFHQYNSQPTFNNAGLFEKTGGTGTTSLSGITFNNTGTVSIANGTIGLGGSATLSDGSSLTGPGDLDAGSTAISGNVTVQNITLVAGNLGGTGTISGNLNWTGGEIDPATLAIAPGGVMNIVSNNSSPVTIWGGTLNNSGTINWSGGNIEVDTGAVINNLSGGVINATDDQMMYHQYNSQPTFNNAGLFEKTGGTGTTSFSGITFNTTGSVEVNSGSVNMSTGGELGGTFQTGASGSMLFMGSAWNLDPGITFAGTGSAIIGATVNLNGSYNLTNLQLSSDTLNGTAVISGTLNWTGGTLNSTTLSIASGAVMNIVSNNSNPVSIWGGTLNNSGTINWSGGNIEVDTGAVINNLSGGVIDATDDHLMFHQYNSQPTFNNAGLFEKTGGTGTTSFSSIAFNNNGTVDVQNGALSIPNLINNGKAIGSGALLLSGTLGGTGTLGGQDNVLNGSVSGTLTLTGILNSTSGSSLNSAVVSIASGAVMNIVSNNSNPVSIWGGTLNNSGTINWSGGNIEVDTGAVINNLSGGVIDATDDHLMFHQYNSQPTFNNAGLFEKTGGTGTTSLSGITFNNTGTVSIANGTIGLGGSATLSDGSSLTGPGDLDAGSTAISGNVTVQNITLVAGNLGGTGTISGNLNWTGGEIDPATLAIAPGELMNIVSNNSSPVTIWGGTLNNSGTINWSGGNIEVDTGAVINNLSGGVINATDDQMMYHQYNSQPTFNNAGLFEKTGGTGTTSFSGIPFTNLGDFQINIGALNFSSGFTQISGVTALPAAILSRP